MAVHNLPYEMTVADFPSSSNLIKPAAGITYGFGTTVGNGIEGWAPGANFIKTDGAAGARSYVNQGTKATASWNPGINLAGAFAAGQAIVLGAFSTPITYTGNELIELHGQVSANTTSKPMMRVRNSALTSAAMTTGAVTTLQVQAYNVTTNNVGQLRALEAHVGVKGAATVLADAVSGLPNMAGGWFKIEDLGNNMTLTGSAACIILGKQFNTGTTLTGDSAYIWLTSEGNVGYNLNAIIEGKDGTGSGLATNLLDIPAALPYDAVNSSGTQSGKIACNIGGSTKYIQVYSD